MKTDQSPDPDDEGNRTALLFMYSIKKRQVECPPLFVSDKSMWSSRLLLGKLDSDRS